VGAGALEVASARRGLNFEKTTDLATVLCELPGYDVERVAGKGYQNVFFEGKLVARLLRRHDFYRFLDEGGVDWRNKVNGKLLPDQALLVIARETLFVVEIRCQQRPGWVFRKLQTCDFKRKQYVKLVAPLELRVEYVYVLNDWFKKPEYKDVLDYIQSVNCHYKFNELPLAWLGLPVKDA